MCLLTFPLTTHLSGDETGQSSVGRGTVSVEDTESEHKDGCTADDEPLQSSNVSHNETKGKTDDDGDEGVDVLDPGGSSVIPGVISNRPGKYQPDTHWSNDTWRV
jgi:hypothetical protein